MFKIEWTKRHTTILIYTCCTILIAVVLVLAILFPGILIGILKGFLSAISPVIFGFAIAYLLHPICRFFDTKALRFLSKTKQRQRLTRVLAVVLTFLVAAAVIALFIGMVVPQIKASYLDLEKKFDGYVQNASVWLEDFLREITNGGEMDALDAVLNIDLVFDTLEKMIDTSLEAIGGLADTVVSYSSKVVSIAWRVGVSLVFAAYFLLQKEMLLTAISELADMLLPAKLNHGTRKWLAYTHEAFGGFIAGKLLNALIITLLNFIVFGLCDIPYYPLIALITGITDMIPYFGPFIGAIPSAFIILIADPIKVIWFAVLVLVIQQIDGNFVGPKILGEKVGVDSLLIIIAITVSGRLWGIVGMFIGVPLFTVLQQAVREFVNNRLAKKGLPTETSAYKTDSKRKGAAK